MSNHTTATTQSATGTHVTTESDSAAPEAKPPVAAPLASAIAVLLALVLTGVGAVAVRDVLLSAGLIAGSPWIVTALNHVDGLTGQAWMVPAGLAVSVLGCLLLFAAVKPRRRTHRPLHEPGTWITTKDCIRLAAAAADRVTGVAEAKASGSARKIALTVTPLAGYGAGALTDEVDAAVADALAPLARSPRVRTRIKEQDLP